MDGKLNDAIWQAAAVTEAFTAPFPPGNPAIAQRADYRTDARLLWDKDHLHVGFRCLAPEIYSTFKNHDDKLYEQDVTEVFMDVGGDLTQFAELQASPYAVTFDCYHLWNPPPTYPADQLDWKAASIGHTVDGKWNLEGFKAATAPLMEDGKQVGWTTELAIPVKNLLELRGLRPTFEQGQIIRANFLRDVYLPGKDPEKREHHQLNWSPVMQGCPHISPMAMRWIELK